MKIRLILTVLVIIVALIGMFICRQILIPEIGVEAAIAQVTEDATGAGVRATDRMEVYVGIGWILFVLLMNMLIWRNCE